MGDLIKALDDFGFIEPVHGKKISTIPIDERTQIIKNMEVYEVALVKEPPIGNTITLNKNFYPDILVADESKEKEQVEILRKELEKEQ